MKNKIFIISLVCFLLDQIVKLLVSMFLSNIILIPGFLSLIYVKNNGVAFSMLSGNRIIILIISFFLLYVILSFIKEDYKLNKINNFKKVSYGLLLGGVIGNLFDRLIRGYVIDYISLNVFMHSFPIFNIADILITISVAMILIEIFKNNKKV